MSIRADISIIGAGPGGYVAALRGAQLGAKVVVIEKRWLGGVCLNEGCIPTKALLRSAEIYALARKGAAFGVLADNVRFDWSAAQKHKQQVVNQNVRGVKMLLSKAGVQVIEGEAAFVRPDTLSVRLADGQESVVASNVLIGTGSRTLQVPIPGLDHPGILDSSAALALDK
ncbi:MAG: FAD-dependent oxidoreductase, partial [Chloroflexi bacterium]|nr:FAD-dependent oxidoreductase [Chloroflexota bacterium]